MSSRRSRRGGIVMGKTRRAVIEVAAELSCVDHFGEVAIRGGHEPDVYGNRARTADPFELLLLQCAQNLGLEFQGKVADFIQEECSLMGQLQPSDLLRDRSRESAFFVAEQLAFEKPGGNGRAIKSDESMIAAGAQPWIARAINSLPVPVSPRMRTVASVAATSSTCFNTRFSPELSPMISSNWCVVLISSSR